MKRIAYIVAMALTTAASVQARIPPVGDPVCALCGVDLKSQQPHKRGCIYYSEPTSEESSSSSSSSSVSSSASKPGVPSPTMPFENGRCPECGRPCKPLAYIAANNIHSGCKLGEAIKEYNNYMNIWVKAKKRKAIDEAWSKMQDADLRIRKVAEEALRRGYPVTPTYSSSSSSSSYSSSSSSTTSQPSTKLKDYTPAPERPMVSKPLLEMPMRQPAPLFSSINETNIRHEKPVSIIGKHEWGEIDGALIGAIESNNGEEIPMEFDIERYNHDKGTAILGTHMDNGRYHWTILCHLGGGAYTYISQKELKEGYSNYKNIGELTDVHFDGQGKYIIAEYTSGYRQVYDCRGEMMREGYNIRILGSTVDGKRLIYVGEDEQTVAPFIIDEDGEVIGNGHTIIQYDDALIDQWDKSSPYQLKSWRGEPLEIDGINGFEDIKAFNNGGSYYLLKDKDKGYAVVGRGFIRIGDWYETEEEAHRIWRDYHPRP